MRNLNESIEELKNKLYEIMEKEVIWCDGKVLNLSQKIDRLINKYYKNSMLE